MDPANLAGPLRVTYGLLVAVDLLEVRHGLNHYSHGGTFVNALKPAQEGLVCFISVGTDGLLVQPDHVIRHPSIMILQLGAETAKVTIHIDMRMPREEEARLLNTTQFGLPLIPRLRAVRCYVGCGLAMSLINSLMPAKASLSHPRSL